MIPKIIHYCWLSNDPMPSLIQNCIKSWQSHLSDYKFILWDKEKADELNSDWVFQAYDNKKYAFAADYIRLYAVYHYGGIYLDTDIEVKKSFNELLSLPYFIGTEGNGMIEAGVFGATANSEWIKDCLKYYQNRSFINEFGELSLMPLPQIMMQEIKKKRNIQEVKILNNTTRSLYKNTSQLVMLPHRYFCAKDGGTGIINTTPDTFCIHHFAMSWIPKSNRILTKAKNQLIAIIGVKTVYFFINLFHLKKFKLLFTKR